MGREAGTLSVAMRMRGRQAVSRYVRHDVFKTQSQTSVALHHLQTARPANGPLCLLPGRIWAFLSSRSVHVIASKSLVLVFFCKAARTLKLFQACLYLSSSWWHLSTCSFEFIPLSHTIHNSRNV